MHPFELLVDELAEALDEAAAELRRALGGRPQKHLVARLSHADAPLVSRWLSGAAQLSRRNRLPGAAALAEAAAALALPYQQAGNLVAIGERIDGLRGRLESSERGWRSKAGEHYASSRAALDGDTGAAEVGGKPQDAGEGRYGSEPSGVRPVDGSDPPDAGRPATRESGLADPPAALPTPLPAALTSFVGRERELVEGARLLRTARLVTLTGVGGVGKTRLALRLVEKVADRFPGRVWLIELAGLTDPSMVDRAVASVIGVQLNAHEKPLEAVARALGTRRVLLILDNCEHLLDVTAALASTLLRAMPNLRVLTTSRQPLHVDGEHVLPVGPLPLLDQDGGTSAAVDLFLDRAQAVLPGFRLTARNQNAVVQACRLLDGLPLALELTVRLLRTLSLDDLLDRLGRRIHLHGAAGAERAAHPRHRTLRAVFDWSYELCSPDERKVWEQLSVFAGNIALPDAEAVCGDEATHDAFEAIAGPVDKSLLTRADTEGRTRLHMLATVRLYGRERLTASGAEADATRRHRDWYISLAGRAEAAYATADQGKWLIRLGEEDDNLRQALSYALTDDGPPATAGLLDGGYALWLHWIASGKVGEGAHWMRRVLDRYPEPPGDGMAQSWCRAQWCAAFLFHLHGDLEEARRALDRIEPVSHGDGEGWAAVRAAVHQLRGLCALFVGDFARAESHSRAALLAGDQRAGMLTDQQALAQLGLSASARGAGEEAFDYLHRALDLSESRGEIWHRSYILWTLAIECTEIGRTDEAVSLLWRSLDLKRRLGDGLGAATVSETLAWALAKLEQPGVAALLLGAAHMAWQHAGAPQMWGFTHLMASRDRNLRMIRQTLGEERFQREYRDGERLGLARALDELAPHRS
ncbi:ATP-binding protein [Microtetraspora glauca]|uniref:AAA family ATPase n=1 Tax=Microtetraspora glauca TaxID=1996 RepID=A0ABV3GDE5_MICGL